MKFRLFLLFSLFFLLVGFALIKKKKDGKVSAFDFPQMQFPEGNSLSKARIELGRKLFYDPILSLDSSISCASCHKQEFAFSDTVSISPGVYGRLGNRNAPTLGNVGFNKTFLFDGFLNTLEKQALVPIEEHAEMDFNIVEVAKRMAKIPHYVDAAQKAYSRFPDAFVITRALSSFQRTIISNNSKFDKVLNRKAKFTAAEERGRKLFFDELYCSKCHGGFNFTNFSVENNGLATQYADSGRMRVTHLESERDLFKVPSLRNISLTAPYMHDGSIMNLREVIQHYMSGGFPNKNKSRIIVPFSLKENQLDDLILFLETLTDKKLITNKKLKKPNY